MAPRQRTNPDRRPKPGIEVRGVNNLCYWCQMPVADHSMKDPERRLIWTKKKSDGMCQECLEINQLHRDADVFHEAEEAAVTWIEKNAHKFRTSKHRCRPGRLGRKLLEVFGTTEDEDD